MAKNSKTITEDSLKVSLEDEEEKKEKLMKRKLWSQEEDEAIKKIVAIQGDNLNWTKVAIALDVQFSIKGRTGK